MASGKTGVEARVRLADSSSASTTATAWPEIPALSKTSLIVSPTCSRRTGSTTWPLKNSNSVPDMRTVRAPGGPAGAGVTPGRTRTAAIATSKERPIMRPSIIAILIDPKHFDSYDTASPVSKVINTASPKSMSPTTAFGS